MKQYINKDVLVTEITHKIKVLEAFITNFDGISDKVEKAKNKIEALGDALLFIENLEVKEVDLDEYARHYALNNSPWDDCRNEIQDAYKAGFELGLKTQKGE